VSSPFVGLRVNTSTSCECEIRESTIGEDERLRCIQCGADRGRLGPRTKKFIHKILTTFGAPAAITIRRAFHDFDQHTRRR
jgi:hypothetical protein